MSNPTVQPDLHHKMSKKIAQLTKVIYHLNTVNEDNTFAAEARSLSHQNEIGTILKDASSKINKFREIVEEKKVAVDAAAELEQFKRKHDEEKAAALSKIESIQTAYDAKYASLRAESHDSILLLRDDASTAKSRLADAISSFESKSRSLKAAYESNKGVKSEEVEAMRKLHQSEIAEVVRSHNEKFNNMLVEQMTAQETLKDRMTKESTNALADAAASAAQALEKLRGEMNKATDRKLDALRAEHAEELGGQRKKLAAALEKAIGDVGSLRAQIAEHESQMASASDLQKASDVEITRLKKTLADLRSQMASSGSETDSILASLREENSSLLDAAARKDGELKALGLALQRGKDEALAAREKLLRELSDGHEQMEQLKRAGGDSAKELERLLSEARTAEASISSLNRTVETLNETIAANAASFASSSEKYEATVASLKDEIAKLSSSMGDSQSALQKKIDELVGKVEETKQRGEKNVRAAEVAFEAKEKETAAEFEAGLAAAAADHAAVVKVWESKVAEARSEGERNVMAANQKTAEAKVTGERSVAAAKKEAAATLAKSLKDWETERNQLNKRIADLSANSATEADLLKGDVATFKKQTAALTAELEKNKSEVAKLSGIGSDLKRQIDELRKELEANTVAAKSKLEQELNKLREHHEGLVSKNDGANADAIMAMEMELKEDFNKKMAALRAEMEAAVEEEKAKFEKLKAASEGREGGLSSQLSKEKAEHTASVERLQKTINDLSSSNKSGMAELAKAHQEEIDRLKKALTDEHDGRMADAKSAEERMKKETEAKHGEEKRRLDEEAREKLEKELRKAAEDELKKLREKDEKLKEDDQLNQQELAQLQSAQQERAQQLQLDQQELAQQELAQQQRDQQERAKQELDRLESYHQQQLQELAQQQRDQQKRAQQELAQWQQYIEEQIEKLTENRGEESDDNKRKRGD